MEYLRLFKASDFLKIYKFLLFQKTCFAKAESVLESEPQRNIKKPTEETGYLFLAKANFPLDRNFYLLKLKK